MEPLFVDVKLWGKVIGVLSWDEKREVATFQYTPEYFKSGWDVSPLVMPNNASSRNTVYQFLGNRTPCFSGLPGLIADSLPDKYGTEIINEWFASRGVSVGQISPLDRLCYIGRRGMGALEFEPSKMISGLDASTRIHMDELTLLADSIFKDRENFRRRLLEQDQSVLDILKIGTSAGGAKAKAIIAYNETTNEVRSGQIQAPEGFTYWLLKFDGSGFLEHGDLNDGVMGIGNIEYAYYRMAIACGIHMMKSRLLTEGEHHHFMTQRYDRTDNGGKIHVQTLAALAHYDRDSLHSYESVFACLRRLRMDVPTQEELYRRMVFNVATRNHDDHTKNHSFLMNERGEWTLSPAYDLCYSYKPGGRFTATHQMSLNGKREDFTFQDLKAVAENVGITNYREVIDQVMEVVSRWSDYAKDSGVRDAHRQLIERNLILF
jgi:serine/threonine-protein kinase HipA